MKTAIALLTVVLSAVLSAACGWAQPEAEPVFSVDFDQPDALEGWSGGGELVEHGDGHALFIERPEGSEGVSTIALCPVPAEEIAGKIITLQGAVRADGVSVPPQSWNGVKVMLVLELGEGGKQYPQIANDVGTYDWRTATRVVRVPQAVTKATFILGLEHSTGKVWFDDITIRVGRLWSDGRRSQTMDRGHDLPRLRGAMHGPDFVEEDFRTLATEWGANHMRWQINWRPMSQARELAKDLDAYDEWLAGALEDCDRAVDMAEELGVLLLVDLHCAPGGRGGGSANRIFTEKKYQDRMLEVWAEIATRYKGRKSVWAYEILNEPVEGHVTEGLMGWRDLATACAEEIRAIEPGKPVVVEPGPMGSPAGFDSFKPLDLDGIIYSCHMYLPHTFTHQGVHGGATGVEYPGVINGVQWDKQEMREALAPARDYQLEFNVPMYIGEFSAIRWAPDGSAYRYLKDLIEVMEEYEWDWAYHAFREWSGWSVEHTTDPANNEPSSTQTDREKLLRSWFALNERPEWQAGATEGE